MSTPSVDRPCSGLIVPVQEAEPLVGPHRAAMDANAALGVPAHVTVLFPFLDPADLGDDALTRVAAALDTVPAFDHRFSVTDWFGTDVLYLAPDDPGPFLALTRAVHAAFPSHPPFGGLHGIDPFAHLTIGHGHDQDRLLATEAAVKAGLPVQGRATEVRLLAQSTLGGPFAQVRSFPLR